MMLKLLTLCLSVYLVLGTELCSKRADIAFLIDSCRSLSDDKFETQKQFIQQLMNTFDIGPDKTRVAALTFSEDVRKEFYFKEVTSKQDAYDRIDKLRHTKGGAKHTHKALEAMRSDLFSPSNGARDDVAKICIILTDGESTERWRTEQKAREAKDAGITILAIGIGDKVNENELRAVVSAPAYRNYFSSPTFNDLKDKVFSQLIGQTICKEMTTLPSYKPEMKTWPMPPYKLDQRYGKEKVRPWSVIPKPIGDEPGKPCKGKMLDVMFVVDMSSSMRSVHLKEQRHFLADLVDVFDVDSGNARLGMVTFSTSPRVEYYLNTYRRKEEIKKAILDLKSTGGIKNTHLALKKVEEMMTWKNGYRPNVKHMVIVLTDGESREPMLTKMQASEIRKAGAEIIAIGVGDDVDKRELESIASRREFVFRVDSYTKLREITDILATEICEAARYSSHWDRFTGSGY